MHAPCGAPLAQDFVIVKILAEHRRVASRDPSHTCLEVEVAAAPKLIRKSARGVRLTPSLLPPHLASNDTLHHWDKKAVSNLISSASCPELNCGGGDYQISHVRHAC